MDDFARCFLLVFGQLAVGGFIALSVPPFHLLERGFYKSTAGVYLGAGLAALAGQTALVLRAAQVATHRWVEVGSWGIFCAIAAMYLASLWSENIPLRARAFLFTLLSGVAALTVSAQGYRLAGPLS